MKCIDKNTVCIERDYVESKSGSFIKTCCMKEINEEAELVQNIIDLIDDCTVDFKNGKRLSSRLLYAAYTINTKNDLMLTEMLPVVHRFGSLLYECIDKIIHDLDIIQLTMSFTKELQKWFQQKFLLSTKMVDLLMIQKSINADINTLEMSLGLCSISGALAKEDDFEDMFF